MDRSILFHDQALMIFSSDYFREFLVEMGVCRAELKSYVDNSRIYIKKEFAHEGSYWNSNFGDKRVAETSDLLRNLIDDGSIEANLFIDYYFKDCIPAGEEYYWLDSALHLLSQDESLGIFESLIVDLNRRLGDISSFSSDFIGFKEFSDWDKFIFSIGGGIDGFITEIADQHFMFSSPFRKFFRALVRERGLSSSIDICEMFKFYSEEVTGHAILPRFRGLCNSGNYGNGHHNP